MVRYRGIVPAFGRVGVKDRLALTNLFQPVPCVVDGNLRHMGHERLVPGIAPI